MDKSPQRPADLRIRRAATSMAVTEGFTLFELLAVIIIIGGILAIAFPRIWVLNEMHLRTDAGRVSTLIRYLNEASATKKVYYRISFDLEKNSISVESSRDGAGYSAETDAAIRGLRLREGVAMEDIELPGLGKVNSGTVSVIFAPAGGADSFTLHLRASQKKMSLLFNPYSGRVRVSEGYL